MKTRLTGLALALLATLAAAADEAAQAEIEHLLAFVATSGCSFQRNGTDHSAADAADHLRLKYRRGGKYVGDAEQFIDRLASESSWTGRPYTVTCDGHTEPSGAWLHRELDRFRATLAP
jgi:Family of unknown function (DUF5329)